MISTRPLALLFLPVPLTGGLIVGLVSWAAGLNPLLCAWLGLAASVALGVCLFVGSDWLSKRALDARPLHDDTTAVIRNQLEELCARIGVGEPQLFTAGQSPAAIASLGRKSAGLVVTDELIDRLGVVELEAVVARELTRIASGATAIDTLSLAFITWPLGFAPRFANRFLNWFRGGSYDAQLDMQALSVTRYPPGLESALTKLSPASQPEIQLPGSRSARHMWILGAEPFKPIVGQFGLDERLTMLGEL